nr:alpha-1A adrenergic receptor [Hydra vulgaris]XP_047140356.1 alpha-1A adrenergic receptor [Hydra vulgaris]
MLFNFVIGFLVGILALLSIVLNFVCLLVMNNTTRMLERPSSYFVINLLVADMLQAVSVLPLYILKNYNISNQFWKGVVCDGFRFSNMITFYVSALGVPLIALDRLIGAACVFQHRFFMKKRIVMIAIITCWIYVLTLCIIPFFSSDPPNKFTDEINNRCIYNPTDAWTLSMLIINCFLPYILILLSYKYFVKFLRKMKSIRIIKSNQKIRSDRVRRTNKIAKISILISICYGVLNGPSVFYYILDTICPETCFPRDFKNSLFKRCTEFIIKYLAFSNSLAPPLIYCFSHTEFLLRLQSITRILKRRKEPAVNNHNAVETTYN